VSSEVTAKSVSEDFSYVIGIARLNLDANKSFLIVEGSTEEELYGGTIVDRKRCAVYNAGNKPKAKKLLITLEEAQLKGMLVIVDADYERLKGVSNPGQNLFLTDTHDLETMLLKSEALVKVLWKLQFRNDVDELAENLRKLLLTCGKIIGYLRWVGSATEPSFIFTHFSISDCLFFQEDDIVINETLLFERMKIHPRNSSMQEQVIKQAIIGLQRDTDDLWQVCRGHDLTELLTVWCNKKLSQASQVKSKKIEEYLRDLYTYSDFQATKLYTAIREWEDRNKPFRVLPPVA